MKYRIKPNLIEVITRLGFERTSLDEKLVGQIIEEDISMMATLEQYQKLNLTTFIAGRIKSDTLEGRFIVPRECLDMQYDLDITA